MKTAKLLLLLFAITPMVSFINAAPNCKLMEEGTFRYMDVPTDPTAYFEIKGKRHTEYHENGKYEIKSKIEWISECTYELTLKRSDNPDLDFNRGATMRVTIEDTQGNIIFYKCTMGATTWTGRLRKTS